MSDRDNRSYSLTSLEYAIEDAITSDCTGIESFPVKKDVISKDSYEKFLDEININMGLKNSNKIQKINDTVTVI